MYCFADVFWVSGPESWAILLIFAGRDEKLVIGPGCAIDCGLVLFCDVGRRNSVCEGVLVGLIWQMRQKLPKSSAKARCIEC